MYDRKVRSASSACEHERKNISGKKAKCNILQRGARTQPDRKKVSKKAKINKKENEKNIQEKNIQDD